MGLKILAKALSEQGEKEAVNVKRFFEQQLKFKTAMIAYDLWNAECK